jgi:hypothetical protein
LPSTPGGFKQDLEPELGEAVLEKSKRLFGEERPDTISEV